MELLGKRTLVNGGSRGIGAAIAIALAEKGADVAFTYQRSADRAASVVKTIEEKAGAGSPFRPIVPTRTPFGAPWTRRSTRLEGWIFWSIAQASEPQA